MIRPGRSDLWDRSPLGRESFSRCQLALVALSDALVT
jgi:hypothetical protein